MWTAIKFLIKITIKINKLINTEKMYSFSSKKHYFPPRILSPSLLKLHKRGKKEKVNN